jgi:hypothetical protein
LLLRKLCVFSVLSVFRFVVLPAHRV